MGGYSFPTQWLTTFARLEHSYVPDSIAIKTQVSDPPLFDPLQRQIPEQHKTLDGTSVCHDERYLKLMVALQRQFMAAQIVIFWGLQHCMVRSWLHSSRAFYGLTNLLNCSMNDTILSSSHLIDMILEQKKTLKDILVCYDKGFQELIVGLQRWAMDALTGTFKNFWHRTLGVWLYLNVGTHALLGGLYTPPQVYVDYT